MASRFLCGFLDAHQTVPGFLLSADRCRPVAWEQTDKQANETASHDFFLLRLGLTPLPPWIWSIPLPIVAIVEDLDCLWHHHLLCLTRCALAFVDPVSAAALRRAGLHHVRELDGLGDGAGLWSPDCELELMNGPPGTGRDGADIDVLLIGLPHSALNKPGLSRMRTWTRLGQRYRVLCIQEADEDLGRHIARARIVLVRRRAWHRALIEACARAAGIPCLMEEETDVSLIADLLDHEGGSTFNNLPGDHKGPEGIENRSSALWERLLGLIDAELASLREKTEKGKEAPADQSLLLARCRHLLAGGPRGDGTLIGDLSRRLAREPDNPALHTAIGLATLGYGREQGNVTPAQLGSALEAFRRALSQDPDQVMARLNAVEALVLLGQKETAGLEARLALTYLDRASGEVFRNEDAGHLPYAGRAYLPEANKRAGLEGLNSIDEFAAAWEQAGLRNAGNPEAEAAAKKALVRWRLHELLAELTGATSHYFEAALAYPQLSTTRAMLGCALARVGKVPEALGHLQAAVDANPLDVPAARNLYQALGETGDGAGQRRLARDLWLLSRMLPTLTPEPWFDQPPPAGDELATIIVHACEHVEQTRECLHSLLRHTQTPFEIILVASADSAVPEGFGESGAGHPYLKGVRILREEVCQEFGAVCLRALGKARGYFLVLLEPGILVTEQWLERMIACSLAEWPRVGMVGPVTNTTSQGLPAPGGNGTCEARGNPQLADFTSDDPRVMADYVRRRLARFQGQAYPVEQLADFCLLMRREVYDTLSVVSKTGFRVHDWCSGARAVGFDLMVALDVFVQRRASPNPVATVDGSVQAGDGEANQNPPMSRPRISLCIIVKNEEDNLPACLASVGGLTDEIVVVDTGSTDRTRAIAEEAGTRVFDFPWVDSFAAARNESLRHATGDWILWMDADDRLDEENREKLKRLLESLPPSTDNVGYVMKCLCLPDLQNGVATVVDHVRLFRNDPRIRWKYRVHEQILAAICQAGGKARWSNVVIHHTGYQDNACLGPKLERALRLLQLDLADNPEEPFTLFNLGWTCLKMGKPAEAVSYLEHSLKKSQPGDSIVRKAYALLVESHKVMGKMEMALQVCRQGRRLCPDDAEMLFEEGCLSLDQGNLPAAEGCFIQLLEQKPGAYFASVDPALYGYRSRHCLGMVYHKQRRFAEAALQWQAVLEERADYIPTLARWAELSIEQKQWDKLDELIRNLERLSGGAVEAAVLRAQGYMARKEYEAAKHLLQEAKVRFPEALAPRVVWSHALLQENRDLDGAERALRDVLAIDPKHQSTQHNLRVLMNNRGKMVQARSLLQK